MDVSSTTRNVVLGLKLKELRQMQNLSLTELAERAQVSKSYLSDLENGTGKSPSFSKIIALARALNISEEKLISLEGDDEYSQLARGIDFVLGLPLHRLGMAERDVVKVIAADPGILTRTIENLMERFRVRKDDVLRAAIRAHQQQARNYFETIEEKALNFRKMLGDWPLEKPVGVDEAQLLRKTLTDKYGYEIDETFLGGETCEESTRGVRWIFVDGDSPRLFVNTRLTPERKAFVFAREIYFADEGNEVDQRRTSAGAEARSFKEAFDFQDASYFAGAVLINQNQFRSRFKTFLNKEKFDETAFLECSLGASPETFFIRISELAPQHFQMREYDFVRFEDFRAVESDRARAGDEVKDETEWIRLTNYLNMSSLPDLRRLADHEWYCRRWKGLRLLAQLDGDPQAPPKVGARLAKYLHTPHKEPGDDRAELFVLSMAYPVPFRGVKRDVIPRKAISLAFVVTEKLRNLVKFLPTLEVVEEGRSCQRCELECDLRRAHHTILDEKREGKARRDAISRFIDQRQKAPRSSS